MTALETFGVFGASLTDQDLSPDVVHHAKRAVVDWYASLFPGAVSRPATLLEQAFADDLGRGTATLAMGQSATTRTAALINGTAAHTAEVDDIFKDAIYHPGAPTIAAALAAAQETSASGLDFLRAVVVGYEVSTRIGAGLGRTHYKFWHNTGTVGTFGAAAAASTLYRLEPIAFTHALATAATFASGLQQAFRMDSMSKPLHSGRAAEGGLAAAQMARVGITGSLDVLDGEAGLARAMSNGPDWGPYLANLGEVFNITRMTFKNHACCGHTFSPIDAALVLKDRLQTTARDIELIEVYTYSPALDVAGNSSPKTAAEARFSIPFVVASALMHGSVRLAAFDDTRLNDSALRQLMSRIRLNVDPELDGLFPGQRAARVVMTLKDGRQDAYLQPHRKGDPELPLSDADLSDKFTELVEPVIGKEASSNLLRQLWSLDSAVRIDLNTRSV